MPETINCPECAKTLRVPDHLLGKTVRCPSCKVTFTAKTEKEEEPELIVEDEPAPRRKQARSEQGIEEDSPSKAKRTRRDEEDEHVRERPRAKRRPTEADEEPRRRREDEDEEEDDEEFVRRRRNRGDRGSKSDWQRVRQGIGYILAAIFTVIGAYLLQCFGTFVIGGATAELGANQTARSSAAAAGLAALFVLGLSLLAYLAGLVLYVVGNCFCLRAPDRRGANTLAKIALGLMIAAIVFVVIGTTIGMVSRGPASSPDSSSTLGAGAVVNLLGFVLGIGHNIVFLFFLRAVALSIHDEGLARNLLYLLIFYIVDLVITIVGVVVILIAAVGTIATVMSGSGSGQGSNALAGLGIGMIVGGCILILLGLAYVVWYIIALAWVRGAITTYLFRRAR
jgi:predicted Zn finger-like uncharacterized protein